MDDFCSGACLIHDYAGYVRSYGPIRGKRDRRESRTDSDPDCLSALASLPRRRMPRQLRLLYLDSQIM